MGYDPFTLTQWSDEMKYYKRFDHWTIKYRSGAVRYVRSEEAARSESLMYPDSVLAIYAPLYAD